MLAKGAARWYTVSELTWSSLHLFLIWGALKVWGLEGVAMAFAALYCACTVGVLLIAMRLSQFRWTAQVLRLLVAACAMVAATLMLVCFGPLWVSTTVGAPMVLACGLV